MFEVRGSADLVVVILRVCLFRWGCFFLDMIRVLCRGLLREFGSAGIGSRVS